MRKRVKIVFILLLLVAIIIQFFQPEQNSSDDYSKHLISTGQVPENIKTILTNACLDCHSNSTNYQWFHKPAPISWMVNKHIVEGKDELNFSEWGDFDIYDKIGILEEMCKEAERKTMPLKSYSAIHRKAKLSDEEIAELCAWAEKLGEDLLAAVVE